jgi:dTDP-4-amino-4,6-dideoxygalactose transaminase
MIPKTRPDLRFMDLFSAMRPGATRCEFEAAVAAKAGAQYGLAFTYAHSGFFALLKALNISGQQIILPAYTCNIMPEVVVATDNVPVFVDADLADYNMDLRQLKSAITTQTKAIVPTHMFGYPTDVDAVRQIADDGQIIIVEDAALAYPALTPDSGMLRGDVALFSFGPGKPLFTVRGGVVVTNHARLYEKLKFYRDKAMSELPPKQWVKRWALLGVHYLLLQDAIYSLTGRLNLSKSTISSLVSRWRPPSQNGSPGSLLPGDYVTRYADFQARLGLTQLRKSNYLLSRRRAVAELYADILQGIPGLTPAPVQDGASYSLYSVLVKDRDAIGFHEKMRARGVEAGCTYNYASSGLDKYRPYAQRPCPRAEQIGREVVNLPTHPGLTEKQVRYIARAVRQVMQADR